MNKPPLYSGDIAFSCSQVLSPEGHPDWLRIEVDILCPRCDYNLRMLANPRCPECGLEFAWLDVLSRKPQAADYLFEHHWRQRPLWSLSKTIVKAFLPFRFWGNVSIHDEIRPWPLFGLVLLAPIISFAFLIGLAGLIQVASAPWATRTFSWPMSVPDVFWLVSSEFVRGWRQLLFLPATQFFGLLASLVILTNLRQTLGRSQIKALHMLRIVAYGAKTFRMPEVLRERPVRVLQVTDGERRRASAIHRD